MRKAPHAKRNLNDPPPESVWGAGSGVLWADPGDRREMDSVWLGWPSIGLGRRWKRRAPPTIRPIDTYTHTRRESSSSQPLMAPSDRTPQAGHRDRHHRRASFASGQLMPPGCPAGQPANSTACGGPKSCHYNGPRLTISLAHSCSLLAPAIHSFRLN